MTTKERYKHILDWFAANMPVAESELNYRNPYELLVAVMLSAQCTDKRVNMVTPALFEAYPTAETLAQASVADVLRYVHSVSYPNAKAEHLVQMAKRLVEVYDGKVPDNIDDLQTLQGVGRKTANVVCAVIWNQPTMAVDTHIFRVSDRLGLQPLSRRVAAPSPHNGKGAKSASAIRRTEDQLTKHIPADIIPKAHHWLLLHGRYVCTARKPKCDACGLTEWCRAYALRSRG